MDFNEEERLRAQSAAGREQERSAKRQITEGVAADHWNSGDQEHAMVVLYNAGWDWADMIRFCRQRDLSEVEAKALIARAPIDRT